MSEPVILSIDELAPRPPRFVEVFGVRYQLVDPEMLDLLAIAKIRWIAQLLAGDGQTVPFETSHEYARAVRDIVAPTLPDSELERMTPRQALHFAATLASWAFSELGKALPVPVNRPARSTRGS